MQSHLTIAISMHAHSMTFITEHFYYTGDIVLEKFLPCHLSTSNKKFKCLIEHSQNYIA